LQNRVGAITQPNERKPPTPASVRLPYDEDAARRECALDVLQQAVLRVTRHQVQYVEDQHGLAGRQRG
jgi:hypothetical protein